MADIKTFGSFKDYLLITLMGTLLYFATNTYMIVNELAIKDAVRDAVEVEEKKWKASIEGEISIIKSDIQTIKENRERPVYIKPEEIRAPKRTVER